MRTGTRKKVGNIKRKAARTRGATLREQAQDKEGRHYENRKKGATLREKLQDKGGTLQEH